MENTQDEGGGGNRTLAAEPSGAATEPSGAAAAPVWRVALLLAALLPVGLLAVAFFLTPDADGLGTHQQLGLPPCSMRMLFGIRCPACGMTTSWSHFVRGQWISSFQANIGGFGLAALSVAFAPIAIRAAATGRTPSVNAQQNAAIALVAIFAVALTEWVARLAM